MNWPIVALLIYLVGLGTWLLGSVWLAIDVRWRERPVLDGGVSGAKALICAGAAFTIFGGFGIACWADPVSGLSAFIVAFIAMYFYGVWPGTGPYAPAATPGPVAMEKLDKPSDSA
jgi:hypothetical protein